MADSIQILSIDAELRRRERATVEALDAINDHINRLKLSRDARERALSRIRAEIAARPPATDACDCC